MITRTCYFPRNQIGRYVLNYLVERVGCSIGTIRKVADVLAVTITLPGATYPNWNIFFKSMI